MHYAPIVLQDGERRVMRLGRITAGSRGSLRLSTAAPGTLQRAARQPGQVLEGVVGVTHAVMLIESFFENVDRDGKNEVLHFFRSRRRRCSLRASTHGGLEGRPAAAVVRGDHG